MRGTGRGTGGGTGRGEEGHEEGRVQDEGYVCCHPALPLLLELVFEKLRVFTTDGCLVPHNPFTRLLSQGTGHFTRLAV